MTPAEGKINVSKWRQRLNEADVVGPKHWVENPWKSDVLLGKQRDAFNHIGNVRFRDHIHSNWERYNNAKGRCERTAIVGQIVNYLVHERNVRFLKKDRGVGMWYVVPECVAREKVGHAIRDTINFRRHHDRKVEEARRKGLPPPVLPGSLKKRRHHTVIGQVSENESYLREDSLANVLGTLKHRSADVGTMVSSTSGESIEEGSEKGIQTPIEITSGMSNCNDKVTPAEVSPIHTRPKLHEEAAMMGAFCVWAAQNFEVS